MFVKRISTFHYLHVFSSEEVKEVKGEEFVKRASGLAGKIHRIMYNKGFCGYGFNVAPSFSENVFWYGQRIRRDFKPLHMIKVNGERSFIVWNISPDTLEPTQFLTEYCFYRDPGRFVSPRDYFPLRESGYSFIPSNIIPLTDRGFSRRFGARIEKLVEENALRCQYDEKRVDFSLDCHNFRHIVAHSRDGSFISDDLFSDDLFSFTIEEF